MNIISTLILLGAFGSATQSGSSSSAAVPSCATSIPGAPTSYSQVRSKSTTWPWQNYKTAPFRPPNMTIEANGKPLAPGSILFSPTSLQNASAAVGAYIMTDKNDLVFAHEVPAITDFRVQKLDGKPYITAWQGESASALSIGHGFGNVTFFDTEYNTPYTVCPQVNIFTALQPPPKCTVDIHEHQMTPWDTMLITSYNITQADLSAVNGSRNGWVNDCLVIEVDPKTNKVLFSWSALAHVPINKTKLPLNGAGSSPQNPFDYFHMNSIDSLGDNVLVNSRHTWSTYLVSRKNGSILWTIEGETGGDFGPLPPGATFRWQHHARAHNLTSNSVAISYFDNHNSMSDNGSAPTNGLELGLTLPPDKNRPPTLLRRLQIADAPVYTDTQGSFSPSGELPGSSDGSGAGNASNNNNQFMGYGQIPLMREYGPAPDGSDLRWQARFGADNLVQSYRVFKQEWHARPAAWNPVLAVGMAAMVDGNGSGSGRGRACAAPAYVSWNGATDVTAWRIYHGSRNDSLRALATVQKVGFETQFNVPASGCSQVGALEGKNEVRRSNVVCT